MFDRYGDRRVVLLGEASHGTAEFYQARAAITRRLIEQHGFTIVAVEADWPDAAAIDRYVRHRSKGGAPDTPFQNCDRAIRPGPRCDIGKPICERSAGRRLRLRRRPSASAVENHAESLGQKVMELAMAGDVPCLRMMLDRVCPIRKGRPLNVHMPPIKSSQDLFVAIAAVWTAIGNGHLTADDAANLAVVVDHSIRAIELHAITERIAALEEARDKRDETSRCTKPTPTCSGASRHPSDPPRGRHRMLTLERSRNP
jgi:hypothetical protein